MANNTRFLRDSSLLVIGSLAVLGASPAASAAGIITWGAASYIHADSDVVTTGTLVQANVMGLVGMAATTVNGVTFAPFEMGGSKSVTVGNVTLSSTVGALSAHNLYDFGSSDFTALSAPYQAMLISAGYADNASETLTISMSGLSVGADYLVQFWVNDSRALNNRSETLNDGNGNTVVLNYGNSANTPTVGQFVVGRFTATFATEAFTFTGAESSQVNAFQLRSIPEPCAAALGGLAFLTLLRRRR